MSDLLDTSMLVRYLTGDPPDLAEVSAQVIDGDRTLLVTDVVIVETAYVLQSVYQVPRTAIVDSLMALLRKANIHTFRLQKDLVLSALLLCRPSGRVLLRRCPSSGLPARSQPGAAVYSLDQRFPTEAITVLHAPPRHPHLIPRPPVQGHPPTVRGEPPRSPSEVRVEPHPAGSATTPSRPPHPFVVSRAGVPTGPCRTTPPGCGNQPLLLPSSLLADWR